MILYSKSELNRCHIPRLVLENMDLTWEEKKNREQELLSKKRVRISESGEGQKPKRLKKMKYKIIG